ncbi:SDR family oxidoreductase [Nocardia thailandica]
MGFPEQQQPTPGIQARMRPVPDCGENTYRGSGKLAGKAAVVTGADSGIGRAVAIAFAREGADVLISYLDEEDDAREVAEYVREAGRRAVPSPTLAPYAATKAAIANLSASLAQLLGEKGIRVNSVAPGPIWTPLIPSTMPPEKVAAFGDDTPLGRAGQPAELAPAYVLLAADDGSYISGARLAVTGGRPIL